MRIGKLVSLSILLYWLGHAQILGTQQTFSSNSNYAVRASGQTFLNTDIMNGFIGGCNAAASTEVVYTNVPLSLPANIQAITGVTFQHYGFIANSAGTLSIYTSTNSLNPNFNFGNQPGGYTLLKSIAVNGTYNPLQFTDPALTQYIQSQYNAGNNYAVFRYNDGATCMQSGYRDPPSSADETLYLVIDYTLNTITASIEGRKTNNSVINPGITISASNDINNAGSGVTPLSRIYNSGTNFTLTAPASPPGYQFFKWQQNGADFGGNSANSFVFNLSSSATLTAIYKQLFTITANAGANGSISPAGTTIVVEGNNQVFNFTPAAHYQIASIIVDAANIGSTPNAYPFNNVLANHTITVNFSNIQYTVTANIYGPGTISSPNATVYREFFDSPVYTFLSSSNAYVVGSVLINGAVTTNTSPKTFSQISQNYVLDVYVIPRNGSDPLFFGTEF